MVNRPKNIGTKAESAVVGYLIANGFPYAERRALRGSRDVGDITGIPGLAIEVKGGDAARFASDNQLEAWLGETEIERGHAGADLGLLVVARHLKNVRDWWVVLWADQLSQLCIDDLGWVTTRLQASARIPVRLTLAHAVTLLRAAGWGDPETGEEIPA